MKDHKLVLKVVLHGILIAIFTLSLMKIMASFSHNSDPFHPQINLKYEKMIESSGILIIPKNLWIQRKQSSAIQPGMQIWLTQYLQNDPNSVCTWGWGRVQENNANSIHIKFQNKKMKSNITWYGQMLHQKYVFSNVKLPQMGTVISCQRWFDFRRLPSNFMTKIPRTNLKIYTSRRKCFQEKFKNTLIIESTGILKRYGGVQKICFPASSLIFLHLIKKGGKSKNYLYKYTAEKKRDNLAISMGSGPPPFEIPQTVPGWAG